MCRSSSLSHFLCPRDFSGTIIDRDIINTPREPLRPADVPFGVSFDAKLKISIMADVFGVDELLRGFSISGFNIVTTN